MTQPKYSPSKVFDLDELLEVSAPSAPSDFGDFWQGAYEKVYDRPVKLVLSKHFEIAKRWKVYDVHFESTGGLRVGGWLLLPLHIAPERAFIVGHGYGGRDGPDLDLPFPDALIFFPCSRGISRSISPPISSDPAWHVLHDIDKKQQYILRGCVEDLWLSVSAIEQYIPSLSGKIGYLGISFSGGVGALALSQEARIKKAHLNVPTFGDHRIRLRLPTYGSGKAVQDFFKRNPRVALRTLAYYDAANAAEAITMPMHFALALQDPVVTPPGQFAIYNHARRCEKQLFVLDAGHMQYKNQEKQTRDLRLALEAFFKDL